VEAMIHGNVGQPGLSGDKSQPLELADRPFVYDISSVES
jgi:hypothetical protein